MKIRRLFPLLALCAITSFAADQSAVFGKWQVHTTITGNEYNVNCTFNQKEGDLSGTCDGDQGSKDITGKVDGDSMEGRVDLDEYGEARFTARRHQYTQNSFRS